MDLFGPTNVKSLMKKSYCLVVTDDFSRFYWVFFLATKDETSGILKTFITEIENQLDYKVKVIRSDNGTEFKNSVMNQFCKIKGIKREFNVARTPQHNCVVERRNRTLIAAARTMDHLGKFDGKDDEGFFVGYYVEIKLMIIYLSRHRISEEDSGMKPTEVDESGALDKDREDDQATRSDVNAARTSEEHLFEQFSPFKNAFTLPDVPNVFSIDDTGIFGNAYDDEDVGAKADLNNLETTMNVLLRGGICLPTPGFEDPTFPNKCIKNMGGYKHSQLKGKSYEEIQGLYERQQKRIQDFTPMDSDKEAQKPGKRWKRVAGSYATHKSPKKPKVMKSAKDVTKDEAEEYEKEKEELRSSLKIISNDDSKVNYEPLSRKFPIMNWEYQLLGKMEAKTYHPLEGHDLLLWEDLRMIFDPDEKDELWMNQLDWKLLRWKLYESCGVHTLFMDGTPMEISMLVEKKYPLIKELLEKMLNLQLEAEEESTMAFELIKFIKSLLEE
ncbi:putative ribonuclease H-like domain-containing protein [Tanacetum coccineum]